MKDGYEIVLIEDDEDNAMNIMAALRANFNVSIRHFDDGAVALNFLFSEEGASTNLILLDLVLPSVDGIEIFKKVKADPAKKDIPIIVLIASSQSKDYVDSLGLHPEAFANKPTMARNMASPPGI